MLKSLRTQVHTLLQCHSNWQTTIWLGWTHLAQVHMMKIREKAPSKRMLIKNHLTNSYQITMLHFLSLLTMFGKNLISTKMVFSIERRPNALLTKSLVWFRKTEPTTTIRALSMIFSPNLMMTRTATWRRWKCLSLSNKHSKTNDHLIRNNI